MTGWPLLIYLYPGTMGSQKQQNLGYGDVTLDRYGWKTAGKEFAGFYASGIGSGSIAANTPLVCPTWWGAHVEYYFARPYQLTMLGMGTMQQAHHYLWTNEERSEKITLQNAFTVTPSDENFDVVRHYSDYYDSVRLAKTITVHRNGKPARYFYVYHLSGWKGHLPVVNKKRLSDQPL